MHELKEKFRDIFEETQDSLTGLLKILSLVAIRKLEESIKLKTQKLELMLMLTAVITLCVK